MLAPLLSKDKSESVSLIANSNIQFLDYEVILGVESKTPSETVLNAAYENTYFEVAQDLSGKRIFARYLPYLINSYDEEAHFKLNDIVLNHKEVERKNFITLDDALYLYNGVWFPVPCFDDSARVSRFGPIDWCRCRVVEIAFDDGDVRAYGQEALKDAKKYHITFAFDTKIAPHKTERYIIPTAEDVDRTYSIITKGELLDAFMLDELSGSWVKSWARDVFSTLFDDRLKDYMKETLKGLDYVKYDSKVSDKEQAVEAGLDTVFYLAMLSFIENFVDLKEVKIISNSKEAIGVSLVLDIGNSRSCGLLYEELKSIENKNDDFSGVYKLQIRDINSPDQIYEEPFASRIEFAKASFSFNNRQAVKNSDLSFVWPSIARVGNEASILASHANISGGRSGTSSPKRYLWNVYGGDGQGGVNSWCFNNFSYQITNFNDQSSDFDIPRVLKDLNRSRVEITDSSIGLYLNANGDATFALERGDDAGGFSSGFCYKATMTFMLMEIFLQALTQINSYKVRSDKSNSDVPRVLKNIILTTPPSMPDQEKEIFRLCVYEAVGILYKSLGYDKSDDPCSFNFRDKDSKIDIEVPEVIMDWNEAECCQSVYIYNETQKVFGGDCKGFIENLRRDGMEGRIFDKLYDSMELKAAIDNGYELKKTYTSARIATVDIGGGTTDLVIRDYSFRDDSENARSLIYPSNLLSDGFKNAGDDISKQLIKEYIVDTLKSYLDENGADGQALCNKLFALSEGSSEVEALRKQIIQQIFMPVVYRIIFHLEHYTSGEENTVTGTIRDFLQGKEVNKTLADLVAKPHVAGEAESEVLNHINNTIADNSSLKNFDIMDLKLEINLRSLNDKFIIGSMDICKALSVLCNLLSSYNVDLLLISGRPSKIPGIREFFLQRLPLPKSRVVAMHQYHCDTWYPFNSFLDRTINDPKTTAAVGALINLIKTTNHNAFTNFKYYANALPSRAQIRYFGVIDNNSLMQGRHVYYTYAPYEIDESKAVSDLQDRLSHMLIRPGHNLLDDEIKGVSFGTGRLKSTHPVQDQEQDNTCRRRRNKNMCAQLDAMEFSGNECFGYRQLGSELLKATPLYKLQVLNNPLRAGKVRRAIDLSHKAQDIFEIFGLKSASSSAQEVLKYSDDPVSAGVVNTKKDSLSEEIFDKYKDKVALLYAKLYSLADLLAADGSEKTLDRLLSYTGDVVDIISVQQRFKALCDALPANVAAQVDEKMKEQKLSVTDKIFGKSKREQERKDAISEQIAQRLIELDMDVKEELAALNDNLVNDKYFLSNDIYDENVAACRAEIKHKIDMAAQLLGRQEKNIKVEVEITNVIGYVKDPDNVLLYEDGRDKIASGSIQSSDIRYAMFVNSAVINPVQLLSLVSIEDTDSNDLTDAFELSLQTVNENERVYWIDTGIIV
ncbi:Uncharacterized protein conserved in bacteria, putative virulence factor [Anaerobiospirillum thomasii]|uniref:virulence factor SrfB n=1 Tax=Anaerobiospirillum thomasii TaxID=179995 RepID=UPI000D86A01C|nr:virulence factor SrfB [Anaerobiospirillum thomasii]SPT71333.1 Uncharacterized protein conserved in bacteria, putative virulence factor [Anaerobiospirillum thomasii]